MASARLKSDLYLFQSTPPRRRRPCKNPWASLPHNFNPRLREGGDDTSCSGAKRICNFNPRLREGGDEMPQLRDVFHQIFQSTPPRRRRPQHIVIPQLSCTYLVSTTFLSTFFSFISQYVVLFFLF